MKTKEKAPSCEACQVDAESMCQKGAYMRQNKEKKRTHQLLDDRLDESGEVRLAALGRVVEVLAEHGDGLGVGLGLKLVTALRQHKLEFAVVCDDAVVDDGEVCVGVGALRV